jgi:hypothetical protein
LEVKDVRTIGRLAEYGLRAFYRVRLPPAGERTDIWVPESRA